MCALGLKQEYINEQPQRNRAEEQNLAITAGKKALESSVSTFPVPFKEEQRGAPK